MSGTKQDWKLFRDLLPGWQEAFMERLNKAYIELLSGEGHASDKFWALEERIKEDKRRPGVLLRISRSDLEWNLRDLIRDGAITMDDLAWFSEEIRERVDYLVQSAQ